MDKDILASRYCCCCMDRMETMEKKKEKEMSSNYGMFYSLREIPGDELIYNFFLY